MIKMVASNFFNTLTDSDYSIPISTVLEIDKFRKNQHIFTVVTGCSLDTILDYNKDISFIDYIISCNGSYIYDVLKEKVIFKKNISTTLSKKIIKKYKEYGLILYTDKKTYILPGNNINNLYDYKIISDIDEFYNNNKKNIYKIEIYCKTKKETSIIDKELKNTNLKIIKNIDNRNRNYLEITSNDIDKLFGIKKLCDHKKIPLEEITFIGSNLNDISSMKKIKNNYCVSNSPKEVIKASSNICSSNDEKAVEKILKMI